MWGGQQGWNQWAMQPAMFNDVPHEQIDWAALAKQWIQMQQSQPPPESATVPSAQVPPQPVIVPPPPPGHSPVLPEELPPVSAPLLKPPGTLPEPFQAERPFEPPETAGFGPKPVNNAFWSKSQWESSGSNDQGRGWPGHNIDPTPPLIGGKETFDYGHMHDNPPIAMQSIDYNHMSEFSYNQMPQVYVPPEAPYEQYWSQVNAAPPIAPIFLKKPRSSASSSSHRTEDDTSQIDAAKRKQLPAWIREGLEKMEQERIKKIEKERAEKEKAEKLAKNKLKTAMSLKDNSSFVPEKSKFDSDSETEEMPDVEKPKVNKSISPDLKRSPSPIDDRTEEEKRQEYMLTLRRLLTEILLDVTDSEMRAVAEEVLKKERMKKLKAQQLASTTSLTSVASGLRGLASYGTESEASDAGEEEKVSSDSEEELYRIMREKKKQFAIRGKKLLADLEQKELEEQKEAIKNKNDFSKPAENEVSKPDSSSTKSVKEEKESIPFSAPDQADKDSPEILVESKANALKVAADDLKNIKKPNKKDSASSDSSSSSSESDSSDKHKSKSHKSSHDKISKQSKDKNSTRKGHSRSSESDNSDRHPRSHSHDRSNKSSSSKKKKYRHSDSSSSSSTESRRQKHSSKPESSHHRHKRSPSYDDRDKKHQRSASPRSYRSSRDSYRSRDSYHRYDREKYKRDSYDHKRSPSPHRRPSKLPKKYRSSRSPSSERESSRKSRRSRIY